MLIIESLAYAGQLTGEDEFLKVTEEAFTAVARENPPSVGKSVAQKIFFASGVMASLGQWFAETRDDRGVEVLADP